MTAAEEAEVLVSSPGEAEAGSVPTGELALSMSTQDPGEGVRSIKCWKVGVTALLRGPISILFRKSRGT